METNKNFILTNSLFNLLTHSLASSFTKMISSNVENLVYDVRLSSVGPGQCSGQNESYEPSNVDLSMKLHYLKGIYWFHSQAAQGLTTMVIKEPMFYWLNNCYQTCGRFRRSESGRPYIKCNDCGVRVIEAQCDKTVDEWLEMEDSSSLQKLLSYNQIIGPELTFSPLLYLQITRFKCGGMSLGISWAHVLGDVFSVSDFMNTWGKYLVDFKSTRSTNIKKSTTKTPKSETLNPIVKEPLSLKRVDPVGDLWITSNNCKMESFSFKITATQLSKLELEVLGHTQTEKISPFEILSAKIWQCVAKVRNGSEPKVVTICKNDPNTPKNAGNNQIISVVKADICIVEAEIRELARLLGEEAVDERALIEETMERDNGVSDFMIYGGNLTFVDCEEYDLYALELNGYKPTFVNYSIQGVGDEGAVLVLPGPPNYNDEEQGRVVSVVFPEKELVELKAELRKDGLLV